MSFQGNRDFILTVDFFTGEIFFIKQEEVLIDSVQACGSESDFLHWGSF